VSPDDELDRPETADGCLYEIATVSGAIVGTTAVVLLLWLLVSWAMGALIGP